MGCNKIIINGRTKLDLTADTVDAAHLVEGCTAHDKSGEAIEGSIAVRSAKDAEVSSATSFFIPAGYYPGGIRTQNDAQYAWDEFNLSGDILVGKAAP